MGDYTNLSITLDLDLGDLPDVGIPNLPCVELQQIPDLGPLPAALPTCARASSTRSTSASRSPSVANCQGLPGFLVDEVCDQLPIPILCPGVASGPGGGLPTALPPIQLPDLGLGLGDLGGLLRPGTGFDTTIDPERGPTMGQLTQAFDPGLVALLVPGMVVDTSSAQAVETVISRRTKIQLVIFVVITLLGVSFVGARYAKLTRYVVDDSYEVTAHFNDSGGVFAGSQVTYRGVAVGKVDRLELTKAGVDVVLRIDKGEDEIPADTLALVGNGSAVGEQYVELQPQTKDKPVPRSPGSEIDAADTSIPIATETLLSNLSTTVESVDKDALKTTVDEFAHAFGGTGEDLQRLSTRATPSSRPPTTTST